MADDESILLRRFAQSGDAEAFSEIVRRYADPVFTTCRRILFDEAGAADAAQETFYQFMTSAGSIKGSLAAWLHAVATSKAIDAIRRNAARTSRERRYFFSKAKEVSQWKDISPYIDRELETLSPSHREVLIRYFFEGKTMAEIAKLNNTSQPTVSRMVTAAVEELRKRFLKKGLIVALFVLKGFIDRQTLQAAPAFLLAETGKMSLIGTTTGVLSSSTVSAAGLPAAGTTVVPTMAAGSTKTTIAAALSTIKAKAAAVIIVSAVGTGSVFVYHHTHHDAHNSTTAAEIETTVITEESVESADAVVSKPMLISAQTGAGMGGGFGGARIVPSAAAEVSINLSDPQATIDTFTELLSTDKPDRWADCFTTNSPSFADFYQVMTDPQNRDERQLQNAFHCIGQPAEILELLETKTGLVVKLLYTVHTPFTMDGERETLTWDRGEEFEVHLELVNIAGEWKIETIY